MPGLESCLSSSVQVDHLGLSILLALLDFWGFLLPVPLPWLSWLDWKLLGAELAPWAAPHPLQVPSSLVISKAQTIFPSGVPVLCSLFYSPQSYPKNQDFKELRVLSRTMESSFPTA